MIEICGTCQFWQPGEQGHAGSITYHIQYPTCKLQYGNVRNRVIKYAESKPDSWCHKRASDEQLASRVKAGLIKLNEAAQSI